jgi:hypothetical protein
METAISNLSDLGKEIAADLRELGVNAIWTKPHKGDDAIVIMSIGGINPPPVKAIFWVKDYDGDTNGSKGAAYRIIRDLAKIA